jgi:diguanylate cyclase
MPCVDDRCGHATRDFVLQEFARLGRESLRETDVLGRRGGEEFLLIAGLRISVSAGLAINLRHGRLLDELIAHADSALYVAKNGGRDRASVAEEGYLATTSIRRVIRQA